MSLKNKKLDGNKPEYTPIFRDELAFLENMSIEKRIELLESVYPRKIKFPSLIKKVINSINTSLIFGTGGSINE